MYGAWNPENVPFLVELHHSRASGELQCDAVGSLDRVGMTRLTGTEVIPELKPGAMLEGWALTCGRTPAQLLVLIDGIVIGATSDFLPRADINEVTHVTSPSGWQVLANVQGVTPVSACFNSQFASSQEVISALFVNDVST